MPASKMENVEVEIKDGKLILTIDLRENLGSSASGKTEVIATSRGNTRIDVPGRNRPIFIGLNVYQYPNDRGRRERDEWDARYT